MPATKTPFLDSIFQIRTEECLVIYSRIMATNSEEDLEVQDLLENEFDNEKLNYPFQSPAFNKEAGLFGAKILYHAAQLLVVRNETERDLKKYFSNYAGKIDETALLSADLCLRFLPAVFLQLKMIDDQDKILVFLNKIMQDFHFSAIGTATDLSYINWEDVQFSPCFKMLYLNRIFEKKDYNLANTSFWREKINAEMGNYPELYWKELH